MSADSYSFKVGQIDCTVLLDRASVIGRDGMLNRFPNVSETDLRQAYADLGLSLDEAAHSVNIFVSKIGTETVLVDSGQGGGPNAGYLLDSMRIAGIDPDAVTLAIITHTHGDHVLGLLTDDNMPAFPNATYVMSKDEMTFWRDRIDNDVVDHRPIVAMMTEKGLRLIDMDEQIIPGMTAIPIPGHTPGQIALLIESANATLMHMADLLHSPMQFAHPEWSPRFDTDTRLSVPSRRTALGRAADENTLALFYHLTFPGLGRVKRANGSFSWEPLRIP